LLCLQVGKKGEFVSLEDTIRGFRDIVNGKYDHLPEQAFYMAGNIDTVKAKAEQIAQDIAKNKALRGTRRGVSLFILWLFPCTLILVFLYFSVLLFSSLISLQTLDISLFPWF
jgi:hypothetical protein